MGAEEEAVGRHKPVEVTPDQYERTVAALFGSLGADLKDLRVTHGERVEGLDGQYAIDTTVRYRALGEAEFVVLIEAKLHKRPVGRSVVQELLQKVQSTGAHKGIVVSSSGFQRGAVEFADKHGMGLVQLVHPRAANWVMRTIQLRRDVKRGGGPPARPGLVGERA